MKRTNTQTTQRLTGRVRIADDTVNILENGYYDYRSQRVSIQPALEKCLRDTRLFTPDELAQLTMPQEQGETETRFEVVNETTLQGAQRLRTANPSARIGVLNFASAKNPGGGFLRGSQAQEESLARSSGLYASLQQCPAYYAYHRKQNKSLLYSDHIIYSPDCPVFKDDDGAYLATPYQVDFITSAAPNRGALTRNQPNDLPKLEAAFAQRIQRMLTLAATQGCEVLVLGAWGCGVFANDPYEVARLFAAELLDNGAFVNRFRHISFSIPDNPKMTGNTDAFQQQFAQGA